MRLLKRFLKASRGFTLTELTVTVGIITIMAAIVVPSVTGVTGSAREGGKAGDMKNADTAVSRYEADNPSTYPITESSNPTVASAGQGTGGVIKIEVKTATGGTVGWTTGAVAEDVLCDAAAAADYAQSIDECFGTIDFSVLVADYLKNSPLHAADQAEEGTGTSAVKITFDENQTTADATFDDCTMNGETCELYFIDEGDATDNLDNTWTLALDDLLVWNVDSNNNIVVFKNNDDYGK